MEETERENVEEGGTEEVLGKYALGRIVVLSDCSVVTKVVPDNPTWT